MLSQCVLEFGQHIDIGTAAMVLQKIHHAMDVRFCMISAKKNYGAVDVTNVSFKAVRNDIPDWSNHHRLVLDSWSFAYLTGDWLATDCSSPQCLDLPSRLLINILDSSRSRGCWWEAVKVNPDSRWITIHWSSNRHLSRVLNSLANASATMAMATDSVDRNVTHTHPHCDTECLQVFCLSCYDVSRYNRGYMHVVAIWTPRHQNTGFVSVLPASVNVNSSNPNDFTVVPIRIVLFQRHYISRPAKNIHIQL